jgi:ketosteroid isomerase-like protein
MSEENVEVVRRSWEALEHGGLDAAAEFWDPGIEWRAVEGALDDIGVFSGRDTMRRYYEEWVSTFDEFRAGPEEIIFASGDLVGAVIRTAGRARGSAGWVEGRYAVVYTVRGGRIVRGREYATAGQAREAAGLAG